MRPFLVFLCFALSNFHTISIVICREIIFFRVDSEEKEDLKTYIFAGGCLLLAPSDSIILWVDID